MIQFQEHFFKLGWFNHQLANPLLFESPQRISRIHHWVLLRNHHLRKVKFYRRFCLWIGWNSKRYTYIYIDTYVFVYINKYIAREGCAPAKTPRPHTPSIHKHTYKHTQAYIQAYTSIHTNQSRSKTYKHIHKTKQKQNTQNIQATPSQQHPTKQHSKKYITLYNSKYCIRVVLRKYLNLRISWTRHLLLLCDWRMILISIHGSLFLSMTVPIGHIVDRDQDLPLQTLHTM